MRIGLWIATAVVGIFFLMASLPWISSREFRESSWGREFRILILALGIVLALLIFNLVKGPVPAAAP